jgi:hypothetical protein
MELYGTRRRDRQNPSTNRSSSTADADEFALIVGMKAAINKLSVGAILFGILGGIVGIAAGLFLGFALGSTLAAALHVSSREGEAAYFTVAIALIVTSIVTPVSILATLYWRGVRSIWLFIGLVMVCASIAAIGASGFGIWYAAQPHVLNLNGPTPLLEFEVKPPAGQSLETLADVEPQLDTDRNSMPGYWHTEMSQNPGARAGYVELYFRTSQRLFVLKFPGREDRNFKLHLPANPIRRNTAPGLSGKTRTSLRKPASNLPVSLAAATTKFATNWTIRIDNHSMLFTSRVAHVRFKYVDLRGAGEDRVEVGEISRLHSRHRFIRLGEVDPNRQWRDQGADRARDK